MITRTFSSDDATIETVQSVITAGNALTKVVSVPSDSDRCLDHVLNQLAYPQNYRPVKTLDAGYCRHRLFNPLTSEWSYRETEFAVRGKAKNTIFTKKTSVSYLPPDLTTEFFQPKHGSPVILMFDARLCNLKNEKYVFMEDALTDQRWWLKNNKNYTLHKSVGFSVLKAKIAEQRAQNIIPKPTEQLFGLSRVSLSAILIITNLRAHRLRALYTACRIHEELKLNVPILIASPTDGLSLYDNTMQLEDMLAALKWENSIIPQEFCQKLLGKLTLATKKSIEYHLNTFIKSDYINSVFDSLKNLPPDLQFLIIESMNFLELSELYFTMALAEERNNEILDKIEELIKQACFHDFDEVLRHVKSKLPNARYVSLIRGSTDYQSYQLLVNNSLRPLEEYFHENDNNITRRIFVHFIHANTSLRCAKDFYIKKSLLIAHVHRQGFKNKSEMLNWMDSKTKDNDLYFIFRTIQYLDFQHVKWLFENINSKPVITHGAHKYRITNYDHSHRVRSITVFGGFSITLTPLLYAAFNCSTSTMYFAERYPEDVLISLKLCRKLYTCTGCSVDSKDSHLYESKAIYTKIQNAYPLLLLALKPHDNFILNTHEKNIIEKYLLAKLDSLTSVAEINLFWQEHRDKFYLDYKRNSMFNLFSIWATPATGKQYINEKVQAKIAGLNNTEVAGLRIVVS